MSSTPFHFPWSEWAEALDYFEAAMADPAKSQEGSAALSQAYFATRYKDPGEAAWKRVRFEMAMQWLNKNADGLSDAPSRAKDIPPGTIGKPIHQAVHYVWGNMPEAHFSDLHSAREILGMSYGLFS